MRIAVTGGTGFLGRYIIQRLARSGHQLRCWHREGSDRTGLEEFRLNIEWVVGQLGDDGANARLVVDCDAVVHAALFHPAGGFQGGEGELIPFVEVNVLGTLKLIEAARAAGVQRFVFISTCAVHDKILPDRPLDETHPLWPMSHYGAHKAAIEKFIHAYGFGQSYPICALRPTGIYGLAHPPQHSKWFDLVSAIVRGEDVLCSRGGKEVHAADVAKSVEILLSADGIAGESYSCCDRYVSEFEVATLAQKLSGSKSRIQGEPKEPRHQIVTTKLQRLGMEFGGQPLLNETVQSLVKAAQARTA